MKKLGKKVLIFDLDGVIFDSKENMRLSWSAVQDKYNLQHIKFEHYFKHIGLPFSKILKNLSIKTNINKIKKCYDEQSIKTLHKIKYFENSLNTLKFLKEKKFILAIVTSKDIIRTEKFLKNNLKLFTFVECHNKHTRGKPYPDQINKIIKKINIDKKDFVYIGDTNIDYMSAKNAKIDFIFAQWGYGHNYNYKYKCRSIQEMKNILKI